MTRKKEENEVLATMKAPKNLSSFVDSAGNTYAPDKNGLLEVPVEVVEEAKTHGCVIVD